MERQAITEGKRLRIAVIGAGASGILALIKLREAGFDDIVAFEKASDLGGTWRDNRYPGITCDVPSHAYRYSFAPNADWSHVMSPGSEILEYLRRTARSYDVERLISYDSEILEAEFVDHQWRLETKQGDQGRFDAVIVATGVLHHPVYPDIPGLEDFEGHAFHSARWDDTVALKGKRVGIIGTGSTSVQIVGAIVDRVEKLTLFQRTAQWILPAPNKPVPEEIKESYRSHPELMEAEYDRLMDRQNLEFAAAVVGNNQEAYDFLVEKCQENLETVADPELRGRLTPNYKVGCKRLVVSTSFYGAIQRPNAELVTEPIDRIGPRGVETTDGRLHDLDILVLATGFNAHQFTRPMRVVGKNGLTLDEAWAEQNQSYLTVATPEFPNWFMIGGPNSPIGNFSFLLTAEIQFNYALQLIQRLGVGDVSEIHPKRNATERFNQTIRAQMPKTIWATGCSSWYLDKKGRVASWPWGFDKFKDDLSAPKWKDFEMS